MSETGKLVPLSENKHTVTSSIQEDNLTTGVSCASWKDAKEAMFATHS